MISSRCGTMRLIRVAALALVWANAGKHASAATMAMKIDSIEQNGPVASVATTGTEFILDQANHKIICCQRIPERRQVATISGLSLDGLKLQSRSDQQCTLTMPNQSITIGADGLLTLSLATEANIDITGNYAPAYEGRQGNRFFLPDANGGVGIYLIGSGSCTTPSSWRLGWTVNFHTSPLANLLVSVFPPRPFDRQQSLETMLHSFSSNHPYPTDQELTEWRKIGSVLTLHSWIWQGTAGNTYGIEKDNSWATTTYVPKNTEELKRVVATAHRIGMKVIPYMSPCFYGKPTGGTGHQTMPQFLATVQSVANSYGFDGVYFDELYRDDIQGSHDVMRQTRRIIGQSGILYVHAPSPMSAVPCPFISTHTTYVLNGEHQSAPTDGHVRWIISDYNVGNSIGTFCYDSNRPTPAMVKQLLCVHARLPYWVSDGTWNGTKYHLSDTEMSLLNAEYLPKIHGMASGDSQRKP